MAVARKEASEWMRRPVAVAASHAIIFLHYGMVWVAAAGYVAVVAGRRFFGVEVDMAVVLSSPFVDYFLLYIFPLAVASAMLVAHRPKWSVSKDSEKGIKDPLKLVVIGGVVLLAFMMLIVAADVVVPLKGSQSARVGSILGDLGLVGACVAQYFIFVPMEVQKQQMMK